MKSDQVDLPKGAQVERKRKRTKKKFFSKKEEKNR